MYPDPSSSWLNHEIYTLEKAFSLIFDEISNLTVGINLNYLAKYTNHLEEIPTKSPISSTILEGKEYTTIDQPVSIPEVDIDMLAASNYQPPIFYSNSAQVQMVVAPSAVQTTTAPKTYYISPTGNDKNSGTSETSAWKSLSKINSLDLNPGDKVLLQGGYTYRGDLKFTQEDAGTASTPITISAYGTGRATINAGAGTGIKIYNAAGYAISNLNVVGSGWQTNTGSGIEFYTDLGNSTKLDGININNVNSSGFRNTGIVIGSWNGTTGYRNISVSRVLVSNNGRDGIETYAQVPNVHENVYFGYVRAHSNLGIPGDKSPTGNGIVFGGVNGGIIERSVAYNNGSLCDNKDGPVGIWAWDSTKVTIQYNESYNNKTGGTADGGGFDLDQNVSNSIMQYNYSHGNDGAGYLLCHGLNSLEHNNNIVRYNISENDGRKNSYAGIQIYGRVNNAEIYNNTVFMDTSSTGSPKALRIFDSGTYTNSVHIHNNIFQTQNNVTLIDVPYGAVSRSTDLLFQGNNYYSTGGIFNIHWNGNSYSNLENWRTSSGQEKIGGQNVGVDADPLLNNPGGGITINNPDLLSSLDSYRLRENSPMINQGLNLKTLFGINPGIQDFHGDSLPQNIHYDIGADEFMGNI